MSRVVLILAVVALGLYCLIECIQTDRRQVRYLPKALWLFLILIPVVGPAAWLVGGRPRTPRRPAPGQRPTSPRRPPVQPAPDDDPAFLARLDQQARLAERDQQKARAEQARTEQSAAEPDGPHTSPSEHASREPSSSADPRRLPEPPTPLATPPAGSAGGDAPGTDGPATDENGTQGPLSDGPGTRKDPEPQSDSGS